MYVKDFVYSGLVPLLLALPVGADDESIAASESEPVVLCTTDSGFIFIDGVYVEAPYEITLSQDGESLLVNGSVVDIPPQVRSSGRRFRFGRMDDGHQDESDQGERWTRHNPARRICECLAENEGSVVVTSGERPVYLDYGQTIALLKLLENYDRSAEEFAEYYGSLPGESVAAWEPWMREFDSSHTFRERASAFLKIVDENVARHEASTSAKHRFDMLAYPLTLLGMVLSVIAFGHLLKSLPDHGAMRTNGGVTAEIVRATVVSLGLVIVLSGLDLVWTLLASQSGQMRELNPLASRLISDPQALIAFKAVATLIACGLLFALRHHGRAQLASWWICLICTMLTFRWLMFNSMFIA